MRNLIVFERWNVLDIEKYEDLGEINFIYIYVEPYLLKGPGKI